MRCRRCEGELGLDGRCEDCGALAAEVLTEREDPGAAYEELPVHVMTDRERISYRGVTIEEGEPERPDVRFERSRRGWSGMIYTTPLVIVMMIRYTYDLEGDSHGNPVDVILGDKLLLLLGTAYAAFIFVQIYFPEVLHERL